MLVDGVWKYTQNAPAKPIAIKITATKSFGGVRLYAGSSPSEQATTAYRNAAVWAGSIAPAAYASYSGESTTLSFPETIYGGSVDQDGNGVKEWNVISSYSDEPLPGEWISDRDTYTAGSTPTTGAQVAYKLAAPETFTATGAKTITAKSGVNTVFSDADSVKVKYTDDTYPIPDAVKALPGYGQSAGNLYNEIVWRADGWDYMQRVGLPATTDGYTALDIPTTTDITDLMTGALPLVTTEPGGTITMHHALADDGLTVDVPNAVKYIRDLKEVASSGTE